MASSGETEGIKVVKPTSSTVLLDSSVVHFACELQPFVFSLQVDENQAGGRQSRSSAVRGLDLQLPPGETRSHSPPQGNLPRLGVDVKQVFFVGQREMHCPVLTLVGVYRCHHGDYLVR